MKTPLHPRKYIKLSAPGGGGGTNRARGRDGLSFEFYRKAWPTYSEKYQLLLKLDVLRKKRESGETGNTNTVHSSTLSDMYLYIKIAINKRETPEI
jgi:hypothetical protein